MLDLLVRYLHGAMVPFRLASYPSEEPEPKVAHPLPPHGMLVDTRLVQVDGRLGLACFPDGEAIDLGAIGAELGGMALDATSDDLPDEFRRTLAYVPPTGQLFGIPVILDEKVTECGVLVFRAFTDTDFIDIPYESFALLEQPRIASFASLGELPAASAPAPRRGRAPAP